MAASSRGGGVCVVGSLIYDLSVTVAALPRPGETVIGQDFRATPGGKGANQAVAAARAGAATTMVGRVGDDAYGAAFRSALDAEGIDSTHVLVCAESTGLGFPVVERDTGQNAIVVSLGANATLTPVDVVAAREAIESAAVLLLQFEVPDPALVAAAAAARGAGTKVVLNPAPAHAMPDSLNGLVDVLVPNEVEACLLLDRDELGDPAEAVAELRSRYDVDVAIITLAELGAVVCDEAGVRAQAAPSVTCLDSVGAGDAFCGYLAAGLAAGLDVDAALARAIAAGSLAVTGRGATDAVPRADAVTALLTAASE